MQSEPKGVEDIIYVAFSHITWYGSYVTWVIKMEMNLISFASAAHIHLLAIGKVIA